MVQQPRDKNPARPSCCTWGWQVLSPDGHWTVRPCEQHLPATHDRWAAGVFEPRMPEWWRQAA